jgi:hypothetical protein
MLAVIVVAATAAALPNFDLSKTCEATRLAEVGIANVDGCIQSEQASKERILKDWNKHSAAEKRNCISSTDKESGVSYVEIETCLEMEDWKKEPNDVGGSHVPGAHGPQLQLK